jgi:hypothetical protein
MRFDRGWNPHHVPSNTTQRIIGSRLEFNLAPMVLTGVRSGVSFMILRSHISDLLVINWGRIKQSTLEAAEDLASYTSPVLRVTSTNIRYTVTSSSLPYTATLIAKQNYHRPRHFLPLLYLRNQVLSVYFERLTPPPITALSLSQCPTLQPTPKATQAARLQQQVLATTVKETKVLAPVLQ